MEKWLLIDISMVNQVYLYQLMNSHVSHYQGPSTQAIVDPPSNNLELIMVAAATCNDGGNLTATNGDMATSGASRETPTENWTNIWFTYVVDIWLIYDLYMVDIWLIYG